MPANEIKASHAISRFIVRQWEATPGSLRYCDLLSRTIRRASAESTFLSPEPFPLEIEQLLSAKVETDLGTLLKRTLEMKGETVPLTDREDRAVALAMFTQAPRSTFLRDAGDAKAVRELLKHGKHVLDAIVQRLRQRGTFFGVHVATGGLFMPSMGTVALPCVIPAALMMALAPKFFVCFVPVGVSETTLRAALVQRGALQRFSVGLTGDRVLVPPGLEGDDTTIVSTIERARASNLCGAKRLTVEERKLHGPRLVLKPPRRR